MRFAWMFNRFIIFSSLALCVGCGSGTKEAKEPELPDWLSETSQEASTELPQFAAQSTANISLNLKPGDRFPLRKVVEQELLQNTLSGAPNKSRSRLELMFAISVLEVANDRTKLNVRYERVNYTHDVADEHVEYDSTRPPLNLPMNIRAYHDMVDDGFSFWLGSNNQIVAVEGFTEFLNRCLRNIPENQRQEVILAIESGTGGEGGLANFVDNTIGLLPFDKQQSPGDSWERPQTIQRPVPMHISNTYTLKDLTKDYAVIDIRGDITPSTAMSSVTDGNGLRVTVIGGRTDGTCTIFRDTGLPKESRVSQDIEMSVMLTGAVEFKQLKRITTTIESFPVSSSTSPITIGAEVQPASYETSPQQSPAQGPLLR